MPNFVRLARRPNAIGYLVDFERGLSLLYTNTADIDDSIDLDIIPGGPSGYAPGILVNNAKWSSIYCVIRREEWDESDYLAHARKRIQDLGYRKP